MQPFHTHGTAIPQAQLAAAFALTADKMELVNAAMCWKQRAENSCRCSKSSSMLHDIELNHLCFSSQPLIERYVLNACACVACVKVRGWLASRGRLFASRRSLLNSLIHALIPEYVQVQSEWLLTTNTSYKDKPHWSPEGTNVHVTLIHQRYW